MAIEKQPNTWYTMYQAFGDSLFELDRFWTKEEDETAVLPTRISQESGLQNSATFKGSKFSPIFGQEYLSLDQLARTDDGEPIYFPADKPSYADITGTYRSAAGLAVLTGRYSPLDFMIDPVLKEDLIGDFFTSTLPDHIDPSGNGMKAKQYRYRLLLKSENGIFVSDVPAVFDEGNPEPYIGFTRWHPLNHEGKGLLYVPLEYRKITPLEIMLQERPTTK